MFLPLIIFLPNAFYYGFNEHATNSETASIKYKYQSNEVDSLDDLIDGNIYTIEELVFSDDSFSGHTIITILAYDGLTFSDDSYSLNDNVWNDDYNNNSYVVVEYYPQDELGNLTFYSGDIFTQWYVTDYMFFLNPVFVYNEVYYNDFVDYLGNYSYMPQYTDYNEIRSVEFNIEDTITSKMYKGWLEVWDLPVFSWAKNTFFSAPFNYISALFGFQAGNSISYLLSYWFSISIIWLVFDLMIYVPLLVHRWLDKASLS